MQQDSVCVWTGTTHLYYQPVWNTPTTLQRPIRATFPSHLPRLRAVHTGTVAYTKSVVGRSNIPLMKHRERTALFISVWSGTHINCSVYDLAGTLTTPGMQMNSSQATKSSFWHFCLETLHQSWHMYFEYQFSMPTSQSVNSFHTAANISCCMLP